MRTVARSDLVIGEVVGWTTRPLCGGLTIWIVRRELRQPLPAVGVYSETAGKAYER